MYQDQDIQKVLRRPTACNFRNIAK